MRRQTWIKAAVAATLSVTALLGLSAGTASAAVHPTICIHVDCPSPL